jgi:hypothetical protein
MNIKRSKDITKISVRQDLDLDENSLIKASRTAFIARFIVLREGKRTKAHRRIEELCWDEFTTAESLSATIRQIFIENGDSMEFVERDIKRALAHSSRSISFFIEEYLVRATNSFVDALVDYDRSNSLLFQSEEQPRPGGWRLPSELKNEKKRGTKPSASSSRARSSSESIDRK